MQKYFLKHRNDICAVLDIDQNTWKIDNAKIVNRELAPFVGKATDSMLGQWWEMRAVPSTRKTMEEVVRKAGCANNTEYLAKNLALSVTDTYWICPIQSGLSWEDVNVPTLSMYNDGRMPYHNATSYDKNAALSGQMDKYWDLNEEPPVLVKNAYAYYGQQAINELFATILHQRQEVDIPFVKYSIQKNIDKGCLETSCPSFVSDGTEFVSAYEVMLGYPKNNSLSKYNTYIEICKKMGIPENDIRRFMDYQTLTDFVISNTDEHLNNFGILRNVDTLEFLKPAPIYDSGNSMYYKDVETSKPLTRVQLLNKEISGMYKTEEQMLSQVKYKNIVNADRLPTPKEVIDIYTSNGISEQKAEYISKNYKTKVQMLKDFQKDIKISLYHEKKREELYHNKNKPNMNKKTNLAAALFSDQNDMKKISKSEAKALFSEPTETQNNSITNDEIGEAIHKTQHLQ